LIPSAGEMTKHQADTMIESLLQASEQGVFFGATNFFSYIAKRL